MHIAIARTGNPEQLRNDVRGQGRLIPLALR